MRQAVESSSDIAPAQIDATIARNRVQGTAPDAIHKSVLIGPNQASHPQ
jgi:hypothetical protein